MTIQKEKAYFSGRKRIYQSVVQGRFKEELSVCDIMTGHEFAKPLKNLPHPFILKTATNFIGKIALGSNIAVHTAQPFMEATLLGTSQVVRGDEPGNEPDISCRDIEEDCSIFGGAFTKETYHHPVESVSSPTLPKLRSILLIPRLCIPLNSIRICLMYQRIH